MTRLQACLHNLERLRSERHRVRLRYLMSLAVCVLAVWGCCFVALDLSLGLPAWICWAGWSVMLVILLGSAGTLMQALRSRLSMASVAVMTERVAEGGVENRLVNAVHFRDQGLPDRYADEILAEADLAVDGLRGSDLYPRRRRLWVTRVLCVAAGVTVVLLAVKPRAALVSAARLAAPMAGIQPFSLTRIVNVEPGTVTVPRGGEVKVRAWVMGKMPHEVSLVFERASGRRDAQVLKVEEEASRCTIFAGTLADVFHDGRYRIEAGDGRSSWFELETRSPPALRHWEMDVAPPSYTRRDGYTFTREDERPEVPVGSVVRLSGKATCPLAAVALKQGEELLAQSNPDGKAVFDLRATVKGTEGLRVSLSPPDGDGAVLSLPLVLIQDQKPTVSLRETDLAMLCDPGARVTRRFRADDDYGLTRVGIERLHDGTQPQLLKTRSTPSGAAEAVEDQFVLDLAELDMQVGQSARFRIWAEDNGPARQQRRGYSSVFSVKVPEPEVRKQARREAAEAGKTSVLEIVRLQEAALKQTRLLRDRLAVGGELQYADMKNLLARQKGVRQKTVDLLGRDQAPGNLRVLLEGLAEREMRDVLQILDVLPAAVGDEKETRIEEVAALQRQILAALKGIPSEFAREEDFRNRADLFEMLQKLVANQRRNLKASRELQQAQDSSKSEKEFEPLVKRQDQLANSLIRFTDACAAAVRERTDDEFAAQVRQAYDMIRNQRVYETMLEAADALDRRDLARAVQHEDEALRVLLKALDILNQWRVKNAREALADATEVIRDAGEKLAEMEETQAAVAEVTRDLMSRDKPEEEVREKLAELDEEQMKMADMVEKLAQDLYQFPELPVCNELNSRMREIYEAVEQALDSENAPAVEIAVQKEDALLDAIRNTKERIEDVEMWLPDVPDNVVWNMESFDTDEFPDIPLVPLPDELEDLVGDLLDQAESIAEQSQDTTGNNIIADAEMGWGVADGPMPSFAAKGKSGNTRPNDNEMTGRSGAGREGQSSGELVEDHVKGLEGTETHARRTQDPLQTGMVTEDEYSTLDARSTGGGKLGGESESIGMFGKAPRRDTHTAAHGRSPTALRREAEGLYAAARLLYLGNGGLGTAARELRSLEDAPDLKNFGSLHRKVLRRLNDTKMDIETGSVVPMPSRQNVANTAGAGVRDVDLQELPEEYRGVVSDYFRSLDNE